jgi:hypothetical protein
MARAVGLTLKEGNATAIADVLTSTHASVLGAAGKLSQDTPICLSFDARRDR